MNKYGDNMKTQKEFLEALEEELKYLKAQEVNEIIKHYQNKINAELDYGTLEAKIIKNLPEPKDIANEIYKSKGISYLEIQKKKYRQKEILTAVISGLIVTLMAVLFVSISVYFGYVVINVSSLVIDALSFRSIIDVILIGLLVIFLDLTLIVGYIYLVDVFYLIITHFLANIIKAAKKTTHANLKFQNFSISGALKNLCKGKNLLLIILASVFGGTILLGGASLLTGGYMYRSLSNTPNLENVISKEFEGTIKDIDILGSNANIEFIVDDKLEGIKVDYIYEFSNKINIELKESKILIDGVGSKTYGLFGILDEPAPLLTITVSKDSLKNLKELNLKLDETKLSIGNVDNHNLTVNLDVYTNEVYIYDSQLKALNIYNCYKTTTKVANLSTGENKVDFYWTNDISIKASTGTVYLEGIKTNNFVIESTSLNTSLSNCYLDNANIKVNNGSVQLSNIEGYSFAFESNSSKNTLRDLRFKDTIKITSNQAGTISVVRMVAEKRIELNGNSGGNINITHMKSKEYVINSVNGNISLMHINDNNGYIKNDKDEITDSEKAMKDLYNAYDIANTTLEITSTGVINISDSKLEKVNATQTGKRFVIMDSTISNNAVFTVTDAKYLDFNKVYGTDIHFVLNSTTLIFKNEEPKDPTKTKFYYKYAGGTMSKPDTDVESEQEV